METQILYAGDTSLTTAASYLAGVMKNFGLKFDYIPSGVRMPEHLLQTPRRLYILSDYSASDIPEFCTQTILHNVRAGAGLLMLGGWESYHGKGGDYHKSPLADALPVHISQMDDRVNSAQPCLVQKLADHPILEHLPFENPPGIGGYNRIEPKQNTVTILGARHFQVDFDGSVFRFTQGELAPLLVLGRYGKGRTAALATDAAPHWVGGMVDWGNTRTISRAPQAEGIEVGNWYAQFFHQLINWTIADR